MAGVLSRSVLRGMRQPALWHAPRRYAETSFCDKSKLNGLVLGLYENQHSDSDELLFTAAAEEINCRVNCKLEALVKATGMNGKLGNSRVFNNIDDEFRSIAVVGLGKKGCAFDELEGIESGTENLRRAAAIGVRELEKEDCCVIQLDGMDNAEAVAEGSGLAAYKYHMNKRAENQCVIPKLELFGAQETDPWLRGVFKAESQNLARCLCEMPANQLTPFVFAQTVVDTLCPCDVNVEVRNQDWIELNNMTTLLTVSESSAEAPYFVEMNYCGGELSERPVLLVGNGLTFNSGGLCLKPGDELPEQRASMAGAASVVATMRAVAAFQLPINVSAVIPLCENMPSGHAFRPGDIIRSTNGKSIVVHDTSNAGVLMLADTLEYAQKLWRPRLVLTMGALTDGVQSAFGGSAAGAFANSNRLWTEIQKAGSISGDRVWQLPLWKYFTQKATHYGYADVSNTGSGDGSPCLASAFLREFVSKCPWLHMDIRGVGMAADSGGYPYFEEDDMTGRPVRTLIQFIYQLACVSEDALPEMEQEVKQLLELP